MNALRAVDDEEFENLLDDAREEAWSEHAESRDEDEPLPSELPGGARFDARMAQAIADHEMLGKASRWPSEPDLQNRMVTLSLVAERRRGERAAIDSGAAEGMFLTARELFAEIPESPEWWWQPFGALGTIVELDGPAKRAGKTTLIAYLVRAVLDGGEFLGGTTRQMPVVMLSEQPVASLRASLAPAGLLERDDLRILTWGRRGGRRWVEVAGAAASLAIELGALLIVDTLPQWAGLRGDTENNSGAALEAIAPLQDAAGAGVGVMVVRHDRKGGGDVGESARGSTAFGAAVDTILQLRRGSSEERPTVRYLSALSRFPDVPAELVIELLTDPGIHSGGAAGMNVPTYVVLGDATSYASGEGKQSILVAIGDGELRRAEIEEHTGLTGEKLTALLGDLVASGFLQREGRGVKGDPQRFRRRASIHSGGSPTTWEPPDGMESTPAAALRVGDRMAASIGAERDENRPFGWRVERAAL